MTPQEAMKILRYTPVIIDPYVKTTTSEYNKVLFIAEEAIEKQIPKKPYKRKEHKQNDYYCAICKCYLGDEMELQNACLQPKYCEHCGQALDWSDTE